jgi:undecaprenyl-diphosphatase
MDWSVVHALNAWLVRHDVVEDPLVAYVNAAEVLFAGMLVVAFAVGGRGVRRAVTAAGLSAALALAAGQVLSHLVDRARPFVTHAHDVHLFAGHAADAGFPSDHATAAFAIAVAILLRYRAWGAVLLVLAGVLSAGRVAIGLHYPSDVLAGAALGSASALALWAPWARRQLDRLADAVAQASAGARRIAAR